MPSRDIPDEFRDRPFPVAEARAAGISRRMLRGSRFRVVTRGVYSTATAPKSYSTFVRATLLTLPITTIVTGVTGLRLYGVLVGAELPLQFATTHPHQVRRQGVEVTRVKHLPPQRGHIAVPEHCWLVAAGELDLLELVTAGDWLLRKRRTTVAKLEASQEGTQVGAAGPRGPRWLSFESALTHRARPTCDCVWYWQTCQHPDCNVVIGDDNGPIGRVDLVYLAFKIIIEYEGDQHRTDRGQWNATSTDTRISSAATGH